MKIQSVGRKLWLCRTKVLMGPIMSDETKIHHSSLCLSQDLGTGISVGAFCFIGNAVRFGKGCTIENNVSIDGNIIIGNNVSIGSGTRLIGDIVIGDNVDIDENVVLRGKMSESSENHPEAKEILALTIMFLLEQIQRFPEYLMLDSPLEFTLPVLFLRRSPNLHQLAATQQR